MTGIDKLTAGVPKWKKSAAICKVFQTFAVMLNSGVLGNATGGSYRALKGHRRDGRLIA